MKILIVGGSGIIGSYIDDKLNKYHSITSTYNSGLKKSDHYVKINLLDKLALCSFIENCENFDVIIFFVALAHKKGAKKDLSEFRKFNYETLYNLVSALQKYDKIPEKFIYASTISVYGENFYKTSYQEVDLTNPQSPYAITKLEAENYLKKIFANNLWILRFSPVYSKMYVNNILRRTKIRNIYYRVGNGLQKLSLCNIDNIVSIIEGILKNDIPFGIFNVSDNECYTYRDLLKIQKAENIYWVPSILVLVIYFIGKLIKNIFLVENSIKLLTDNIFSSNKVSKFIDLKFGINNLNEQSFIKK